MRRQSFHGIRPACFLQPFGSERFQGVSKMRYLVMFLALISLTGSLSFGGEMETEVALLRKSGMSDGQLESFFSDKYSYRLSGLDVDDYAKAADREKAQVSAVAATDEALSSFFKCNSRYPGLQQAAFEFIFKKSEKYPKLDSDLAVQSVPVDSTKFRECLNKGYAWALASLNSKPGIFSDAAEKGIKDTVDAINKRDADLATNTRRRYIKNVGDYIDSKIGADR
jgi:hypothetical protein